MAISNIFKKLLFSRALHFGDGKVEILGLDGIILPISVFCDFQKKITETASDEVAIKAIEFFGRSQGKIAVKSGSMKFGKLGEKFLEMEISLAEMLGWGEFKLMKVDFKKKTGIVHVNSNFSKEYVKKFGKSKKPVDYFIKGLIEGFTETFAKCEMECKETKCIGMGDPYCEFIFSVKKK